MAEQDERIVERVRSLAERLPVEPPDIDPVLRRGRRRRMLSGLGTAGVVVTLVAALIIPLRSLLPIGGHDRDGPSAVLEAAPRECPVGIIRASSVGVDEFRRLMNRYLPTWLPKGFGLLETYGPEGAADGFDATGIWSDARCRVATLTFSSAFRTAGPTIPYDPSLPQVGPWTLRTDEADACGNAVLGTGRCLEYLAVNGDGVLSLSMIGLERDEGDRIALSILSDGGREPPPPAGTIAYILGRQGFGSIALLDVTSGNVEPRGRERYNSIGVAWSPDGTTLALTRGLFEGNGEIILVAVASGAIVRTLPIDPLLNPQYVVWAPDGRSLAFTSTSADLWIIGTDGSDLRQVPIGAVRASGLSWSPDGNTIAFVASEGSLALIEPTGGDPQVLFDREGGRAVDRLAWSPDGEWIGFSAEVDGTDQIFVIRRDGSDLMQLTDSPENSKDPTWSPDGEWIAFTRGGDHWELFAVTPDGSLLLQLTDSDLDEYGPDWA